MQAKATITAVELGLPETEVTSLEGEEAVSSVVRWTAMLVAPPTLDLRAILDDGVGREAALRIEGPTVERRFTGDIVEVGATTTVQDGGIGLRLEIASPLIRLRRRRTSRVFPTMSVIDVMTRVLEEHGVPHEFRLHAEHYPPRGQCLQYRESDYDLFARLAAEAGLFFWHRQRDEVGVLVVADHASHYDGPPVPLWFGQGQTPSVPFGAATDADGFEAYETVRRSGVVDVVTRHYDVERPHLSIENQTRDEGELNPVSYFERTSRPERATPGTAYHHDSIYIDGEREKRAAAVRREQYARRARTGVGRSHSLRLHVGATCELGDHPVAALDNPFVVTRLRHRLQSSTRTIAGEVDDIPYTNEYDVVPASVPYRPPPLPRPAVQHIELATVVGPEVDAVHTDELGRVKVRFHWERGDETDGEAAWARVAETWAGRAWGTQFLPRVGMEVAVAFVAGDPEQPLVLHSLYNGINPHPFPPPDQRSWSAIKGTSHGGEFPRSPNALMFNDAPGREEFQLRTPGIFTHDVGHRLIQNVGERYELGVDGDKVDRIRGELRVDVSGSLNENYEGDRWSVVAGGSFSYCREVNEEVETSISRTCQTEIHEVKGTYWGRFLHTAEFHVGRPELGIANGSLNIASYGHATLRSPSIHISGEDQIRLTSGASVLTITPQGIELDADRVAINARESAEVRGPGGTLLLEGSATLAGGTVVATTGGASLVLDSDAHLDGGLVKLNCGGGGGGGGSNNLPEDEPTRHFRVKYGQRDGPLAGARYILTTGGFIHHGFTDAEGAIDVHTSKRSPLTHVMLIPPDRPDEPRIESYTEVESIPPADDVKGAAIRLMWLHYTRRYDYEGAEDPAFVKLVRSFQQNEGLPESGVLDAATSALLARRVGGDDDT
ncbi:MAG: type VI secretion system tip protein TssI/VgrG [Myxococcota bacterium]